MRTTQEASEVVADLRRRLEAESGGTAVRDSELAARLHRRARILRPLEPALAVELLVRARELDPWMVERTERGTAV